VELPAPISGKILKVNEDLEDTPDLINQDTFAKGWIALISLEDSSELNDLMTKADYDFYVAGSE
jgi:glycine cleavage system H protein